jgi:glycosyltransferase involved in cell wall biosynthesis
MPIELMPFKIGQAIIGRSVRSKLTRLRRQLSAPRGGAVSGSRRLFVDMAVISEHDARTGIQRVVRMIALALLDQAPAQWDVQFVSARRKKRYFRIAWPDRSVGVEPAEMRAAPGDVFVGLDYSLDAVRRHRRQLAQFRRDGGSLWFLVHDLLPLNRAEWFSQNTVIRYKAWLTILAGIADGFLCNSLQTETELKDALADGYGLAFGYRTQVLPMGHAILDHSDRPDMPDRALDRFDTSTPFALVVGTLEPRKGHIDVIAAFEQLWQRGSIDRLVLIGRLGWQVDALRKRIVSHAEYGSRLLWFDDVEDAELFGLYAACTGVIVASHGEGFGLPLIEALSHGKPVLARDIPVFRVHDGRGVTYFSQSAQAPALAEQLEGWLGLAREGAIIVRRPTNDWRDAARILLEAVAQAHPGSRLLSTTQLP